MVCGVECGIDGDICVLYLFFFQAEDGIRDADVTGVQTCALPISGPEKIGGVVGNDEVGTLHTIVVAQHVAAVGPGAPALVGVGYGIDAVGAVASHTEGLLNVVPFGQLRIEGQCSVVLHAELVFSAGFFGGDEDDAVTGATAVEGRGGGAFQYRHAFNVVWIDAGDAVAQIVAAAVAGTAVVGVVEGYAVDNIQGLVVAGHFGAASQNNAG